MSRGLALALASSLFACSDGGRTITTFADAVATLVLGFDEAGALTTADAFEGDGAIALPTEGVRELAVLEFAQSFAALGLPFEGGRPVLTSERAEHASAPLPVPLAWTEILGSDVRPRELSEFAARFSDVRIPRPPCPSFDAGPDRTLTFPRAEFRSMSRLGDDSVIVVVLNDPRRNPVDQVVRVTSPRDPPQVLVARSTTQPTTFDLPNGSAGYVYTDGAPILCELSPARPTEPDCAPIAFADPAPSVFAPSTMRGWLEGGRLRALAIDGPTLWLGGRDEAWRPIVSVPPESLGACAVSYDTLVLDFEASSRGAVGFRGGPLLELELDERGGATTRPLLADEPDARYCTSTHGRFPNGQELLSVARLGEEDPRFFWRERGGAWRELANERRFRLKAMYPRGEGFIGSSWHDLALVDVLAGRTELPPRICPHELTGEYTYELQPLSSGELVAGVSTRGDLSWLVERR